MYIENFGFEQIKKSEIQFFFINDSERKDKIKQASVEKQELKKKKVIILNHRSLEVQHYYLDLR